MNTEKKEIRRFIRHTLGCTCPDEVFEHIDIESMSQIDHISGDFTRLVMGNRLLVYIWKLEEIDLLLKQFSSIFQTGKNERDQKNLNRFRLVIGTPWLEEAKQILEQAVASHDYTDDKSHLHILEPSELFY